MSNALLLSTPDGRSARLFGARAAAGVHARMFGAMDLDDDGRLTSEEMQEFMWSATPTQNDE